MEKEKIVSDGHLKKVEKDLLELRTSKEETIWIGGHFAEQSEEYLAGSVQLSIKEKEVE